MNHNGATWEYYTRTTESGNAGSRAAGRVSPRGVEPAPDAGSARRRRSYSVTITTAPRIDASDWCGMQK